MDINNLSKNPEQIKQLITLLESMLDNTDTTPVIKDEHKPIKTKSRKRNQQNTDTNKFLSMAEMHMHKEDIDIDKTLQKHPPTPRNRPSVNLVSVQCRVCGKQETVSSGLLFEGANRYKCNNCSTSAG